MSSIASATGMSATASMKFILKRVFASTADKTKTIASYLKTPNARLTLHILFLQALVLFGANRYSMLILEESTSNTGVEDKEDDDKRATTILPSKVASWFGRTARFGICWVSVCSSMLFTAHVLFDVLFCYKIERVDVRGCNQSGVSEHIKEFVRFAENFFE